MTAHGPGRHETRSGRDLGVIGFVVLVVVYLVSNLVVDVLYAVLDPRIRYD